MWERLDSRLSPYRTPGAERFSEESCQRRFPYRYIFTLTLTGVGDIFAHRPLTFVDPVAYQ